MTVFRTIVIVTVFCLISLPGSSFGVRTIGIEIDGNYEDDPANPLEDWYPNYPPIEDPFGKDDLTLCGSSPSPKNDITFIYATNDSDYLYVAMDRLANTGQTSFFWSFDITGDGPSKGDFIFVFCFGSGSTVTDTYVLEWDEYLGEWAVDATPPTVNFTVNTKREVSPFGSYDRHGLLHNVIDRGKFAEASIYLDDIEGFDICAAANVTLEIQTKSSCSLSSECKDTSGEIPFSFYPPVVELTLSQPDICEPTIVAHADVTDGNPPFIYQWFLDGVDITSWDPLWSVSDTISIELTDECGPVEIAVVLTDQDDCVTSDRDTINVNQVPEARIGPLDIGTCDLTISYDGTTSTDCNTADMMYFAWDFNGDSMIDSISPTGTYTYPSCGEYTIMLIVADQWGCISEPVYQTIYVNDAPVAGLSIPGGECMRIDYDSTSRDCDLGTTSSLYSEFLTYLIDFGDGHTSTSPVGSHTYDDCGTYTIVLAVTDAMGCTDTLVKTVHLEMIITFY